MPRCSVAILLPIGGFLLLCLCLTVHAGDAVDLALVKNAGHRTGDEDLLSYFHKHMPSKPVRDNVLRLLEQHGREPAKAIEQIVAVGPAALPVLRQVPMMSAEHAGVCAECIRRINSGEAVDVTAAAARLLAQRRVLSAIDPLLHYASFAGDVWLEHEVLKAVGMLAVRADGVDERLLQALKASAPQRGYAALVLGSHGGFEHRAMVRNLLGDSNATVRSRAVAGLLGSGAVQEPQELVTNDEALLRQHGIALATPALFKFLHSQVLVASEHDRVNKQIRNLGDESYAVRAQAFTALTGRSRSVLGLLRNAQWHADEEIARRVRLCIDEITSGPGPELPAAVCRLLVADASRAPATEIIRLLLDYAPFAEDEILAEEVVKALCLAATRQPGVEPLLTRALSDPHAARRSAAAAVLGRVGVEEQRQPIAELLRDTDAAARFSAAQALLDGKDARALPALIAMLEGDPPFAARAEEILQRLAGERSPLTSTYADAAARQEAVKLWQAWLDQSGGQVAWERLQRDDAHRGLLTIAEYESARGRPGGRIWERGRDGDSRWMFNVYGAMDAHTLPNGRVLVAENIANRVTERDTKGEIKWEFALASNPISCQRLPNGNTFIATYNELLEVTPDRRVVYSHKRGTAFFIFSAQKLPSGRIVCMTAQGTVLEIDARTGKELRAFQVNQPGGWCSVEMLPNGHYLVATMSDNTVREIDANNKVYWSCQYPGAFRASRLPNGHILIASMSTRKVAEFDRTGALRWESTCEGRPWSIRHR